MRIDNCFNTIKGETAIELRKQKIHFSISHCDLQKALCKVIMLLLPNFMMTVYMEAEIKV
jgi:hypothetical protein